jgi:hypothetical protein
MKLVHQALLMKLGSARQSSADWRLVDANVAPHDVSLSYALNRSKQRPARWRESQYLMHNTRAATHRPLFLVVLQCAAIETAFKNHNDDLQPWPIFQHPGTASRGPS